MSNAPWQQTIRAANVADAPTIRSLIRGLAEYERLTRELRFDEEQVSEHLFRPGRYAEVLLAEDEGHSYSIFVGKPGIYLEDLFVLPGYRGRGLGGHTVMPVGPTQVVKSDAQGRFRTPPLRVGDRGIYVRAPHRQSGVRGTAGHTARRTNATADRSEKGCSHSRHDY